MAPKSSPEEIGFDNRRMKAEYNHNGENTFVWRITFLARTQRLGLVQDDALTPRPRRLHLTEDTAYCAMLITKVTVKYKS